MKVVKYVLGVLFILGGISSIAQGIVIAGLLMFVLGALFLPPVSEQLKEKFSFWQRKGIRYVSYIVLLGIIGAFVPIDELDAQALKEVNSATKNEYSNQGSQSSKKLKFKTCNFLGDDFYIIPDLIAADVYPNLDSRGFTINKSIKNEGTDIHCYLSLPDVKYDVIITGCSPNELITVETTAIDYSGNNLEKVKSFLGFMATLPYKDSKPEEARAWVEKNINKDGAETTIGGVTFSIHFKSKHSKFMRMEVKEDKENKEEVMPEKKSSEKKITFDGNGNMK